MFDLPPLQHHYKRYRTVIITTSLLLVPILFFYDIVFLKKSFVSHGTFLTGLCHRLVWKDFSPPTGGDTSLSDPMTSALYNEPMALAIQKSVQSGKLQRWNHLVGLGTPLFGNIQVGTFFPLNWLAYFSSGIHGLDLVYFFRLCFSFWIFWLYLRRGLEFTRLSALSGALAYAFTGHMLMKLNMNSTNVYAAVPLYLWASHALLKTPISLFAITSLPLSIMLIVSAGFPQASLGALYFCAFYQLAIAPLRSRTRRYWGMLILLHLLGVLLAGPQLMVLNEQLASYSSHYRATSGLSGISLQSFIFGLLFRYPGFDVLHPGWITVFGFFLMFFGIAKSMLTKDRFAYWLLAAAIIYGLKAINVAYISDVIFRLPFTNIVHFSRDFSLFFWVPLCLFIAYAINNRLNLKTERRLTILIAVFAFTIMWLNVNSIDPTETTRGWAELYGGNKGKWYGIGALAVWLVLSQFVIRRLFPVIITALLVISIFAQINRKLPYRQSFDYENSKIAKFIQSSTKPEDRIGHIQLMNRCVSEITQLLGYNSFISSEPLQPVRMTELIQSVFECVGPFCLHGFKNAKTNNKLYPWGLFGVNRVLENYPDWSLKEQLGNDYETLRLVAKHKDPSDHGEIRLFENPKSFPRAFAMSSCRLFNTYHDVYSELLHNERIPEQAFIDTGQPLPSKLRQFCTPTGSHASPIKVDIELLEHERVFIKTNFAKPMILVLTDVLVPQWKAYADGAPLPVFHAFGVYRAILLTPGPHQIEFRYESRALAFGFSLFMLGLLGQLFLILVTRKKFHFLPLNARNN